jgi:ABC-type sugar transport system substrate-binding protein
MHVQDKSSSPRLCRGGLRMAAVGLAGVALFASGCGSSDDTETSTGSAGAGTSASTAPASSDNPALAAAQERVIALSEPPTDIGVSEPLRRKPTGKVVFMRCSQPICERQSRGVAAAARAMGMEFADSPPLGFTPETVTKGWESGLAMDPAIIVAPGTPTQLFAGPLRRANDARIPVITWSVPDAPGTVTIYGNAQSATTMSDAASFIAADSNGDGAHVLYLKLAGGGVPAGIDGYNATIARACPDCKTTELDIAIADLGRNVAGKVVSALQKDPDIDWITGTFGDMYIGVPPAVKAAGIGDVKSIFPAGQQTSYEYIENGQQTADIAFSMEFFGFKALDTAARILDGQYDENQPGDIPTQFLTERTLDFPPAEPWPSVPGFQQKFADLWNSGS